MGDDAVEEVRKGLAIATLHERGGDDGAHAGHVAAERDEPEPPVLEEDDVDVPLLLPRLAGNAPAVSEEGRLVELGQARLLSETRSEERVPARRIDDDGGLEDLGALRFRGGSGLDAHGPFALEQHLRRFPLLANLR